MTNTKLFSFATPNVTLENSFLTRPDQYKQFSIHMLLDDTEAGDLWARLELIRNRHLKHLPQAKLSIPGKTDAKSHRILNRQFHRFIARTKYQPDIVEGNEEQAYPHEVPDGAVGQCFLSLSPYLNYGGGIRLCITKVQLVKVTVLV